MRSTFIIVSRDAVAAAGPHFHRHVRKKRLFWGASNLLPTNIMSFASITDALKILVSPAGKFLQMKEFWTFIHILFSKRGRSVETFWFVCCLQSLKINFFYFFNYYCFYDTRGIAMYSFHINVLCCFKSLKPKVCTVQYCESNRYCHGNSRRDYYCTLPWFGLGSD